MMQHHKSKVASGDYGLSEKGPHNSCKATFMNTLCHAGLIKLVEERGERFVSLYMPTYPPGRKSPQNPIRFKALLNKASEALAAKGTSDTDVHKFLQPAAELLERPVFWEALGNGLAIFASARGLRVWHLPFDCEELCMVGKSFHVTPLIKWFYEDAPFYLLAVSQNGVRLLRCTRHKLVQVDVPRLPTGETATLNYDTREGLYQTHTGQPQLRGKESLVFTGQGGEADVAKQELAEYFRLIDGVVGKFLMNKTEPLVFAGVDYLYPIYRQHNHYPHLLSKHIAGNPDLLSSLELRQRAWPLVEELLRGRQQTEIAKYWEVVAHGRGCNRVEEIAPAAHSGMIETLFICPTIRAWGVFDPRTQITAIDERPQNDSEELINLAVCLVLQHGGKVEPMLTDNIPGGGAMAAVLRYTNAAALA